MRVLLYENIARLQSLISCSKDYILVIDDFGLMEFPTEYLFEQYGTKHCIFSRLSYFVDFCVYIVSSYIENHAKIYKR